MNCPKGKIRRDAYNAVRSSTNTTHTVKSTCVKDVGKPGKTSIAQRIVSADQFDLSTYGYINIVDMKSEPRHAVLKKAIKDVSVTENMTEHDAAVKVMRRLNYLYVLTKNTQPTLNTILERDRNWIGRTYLGKNYSV